VNNNHSSEPASPAKSSAAHTTSQHTTQPSHTAAHTAVSAAQHTTQTQTVKSAHTSQSYAANGQSSHTTQIPQVSYTTTEHIRPITPSPSYTSQTYTTKTAQAKNTRTIRRPSKGKLPVVRLTIALFLVAILAIIVLSASFLKLYKPAVDTGVPFDTGISVTPVTDSGTDTVGNDTTATDNSQSGSKDKSSTPTVTETTPITPVFKRDKNTVNFLVVGRDVASWNTDVIMLVNFNMKKGSLSVMQLPRDTYVEIDGVHGRINTAMVTLRNAARKANPSQSQEESLKVGMSGFCELLEKSLCIQIDGYAHINLEGFRGIVNAIGGVYMEVPCDMDYEDPEQNLYIHLKEGYQLLDGEKAEMLVRFRDGYVQADIGRMDAQKLFLTALFKQIKKNLSVSTIGKLVEQIYSCVTTDVPLADIIIYAKELLGVDMDNISMMTLHGAALQTETGAWYYAMNRAATLEMINEYFNVYSEPITDEWFDRTGAFSQEDSKAFSRVYLADPNDLDIVQVHPEVQTGADIDEDGLNILLK